MDDSSGNNLTVLGTDLANSQVIFAFDYATGSVGGGMAGIPEAPHSDVAGGDAARTGLFIAANTTAGVANEVSAYINDPNSGQPFSVSGNYTVQVDAWMNYELLGSGTTENGGFFIGGDGTSLRPNGAGFIYTGDGGFAGDYMLFKGSHPGQASDAGFPWSGRILSNGDSAVEAAQYDQALYDAQPTGSTDRVNEADNPLLATSFCSGDCSGNPNGYQSYDVGFALDPDDAQGSSQVGFILDGAGGFRWMTITMEVEPNTVGPAGVTTTPGVARVSITTYQQPDPENPGPLDPLTVDIGVIDNSTGGPVVDMTGNVMLTYGDFFSSLNTSGFNFGVFDNLIITQDAAPGLTGDYNNDNKVDAADYAIWRKNEGTTNTLPNDPTGGTIGQAQYDAWVSNFGSMAPGSGGGSVGAVPEPGSIAMAILGLLAAGIICRRRG